jgi:hypothetical protein
VDYDGDALLLRRRGEYRLLTLQDTPGAPSYFLVRKAAYGVRLAGRVGLGGPHSRGLSITSRITSSYAPAEPSTQRSLAMTPRPTQRSMPLGPR